MPHPTWQELYNAALVEFDLAKLPERVESACQAIHQYRGTLHSDREQGISRGFNF